VRYTIRLTTPDYCDFLTQYNPEAAVWSWTSMLDRVHWLTLAEAHEFLRGAAHISYCIVSEDDVRSKLVERVLTE
jgi:hypothetical protein